MNKRFKNKITWILLILLSLTINTKTIAINIPKDKTINLNQAFIGIWDMQTIVTKSNCPYIIVGSTTESKLEIKPTYNKSNSEYQILWRGGTWTDSIGTIKLLNEKEAVTERETQLKTKDNNNWKAILIDHLKLDEESIMHSESIVIQYKNGIKIGEYRTYSLLTKSLF